VRFIAVIAIVAACGGTSSSDDSDDDGDGVVIDAAPHDDGAPASLDSPAASTDPGEPGPWMVVTQANVTMGTVTGNVYSPSSDGTTPAAGPFPLVVVSSGYQLARTQYAMFCQHLATWGLVCLTHDYAASGNHQAKAREVSAIIDWALSPASGIAARVQADAIGVAGHSLGGKVSINAAILDARIGAVVGWDPVDALPPVGNDGSMSVTPEMMGNLRVPLAVLGETADSSCAPTADNYQQFFTAACESPSVLEVTVAMADHMDWIGDRASCGLACLVCQNGQTADTVVHTITKRVTAAWFRRHLLDDTAMDPWLLPGQIGSPTMVRVSPGC
jgi:dienelactone hydrolase